MYNSNRGEHLNMKKITSLTLGALLLSFSNIARAELLENLKFDGSIEAQAYALKNADVDNATVDKRSETRTRLMLGSTFDLEKDVVSGRVLVSKHNRIYGAAGGSENTNTVQNNLLVDEAYLKIPKLFNRLDANVGRQFYGDKGDLAIYFGPVDDNDLNVTSLDIARIDSDAGIVGNLTAIVGKVADAGGNADTDTDLWGLDISNDKLLKVIKSKLGVYFYQARTSSPPGSDNNLAVYGLKLNGNILDSLTYNAEVAMNGGHDAGTPSGDYKGNAFLAGAEWKAGPISVDGGFAMGSGDDDAADADHDDFRSIASDMRFGEIMGKLGTGAPTTIGQGGDTGVGLNNNGAGLTVFHAGVGYSKDKWGVKGHFYNFTASDVVGDDAIGNELDLIGTWKHSENVGLRASAAVFLPGDRAEGAVTDTGNVLRYGLGLDVKFGS